MSYRKWAKNNDDSPDILIRGGGRFATQFEEGHPYSIYDVLIFSSYIASILKTGEIEKLL